MEVNKMNDKQLIEQLGGSTKVAEMLGFKGVNGARRVNNWKKRGIPAQVKLDNPKLFPHTPVKP
jgi:hypothetical protein|uniref:Uncharacterized protein n=1 Tax=Myoviridae sp. ctTK08 TaxID=2826656 RepID=A0A8S5QVJ9_9CAUD|nr:MAG TPA: hypothetical protein [Myoviridae sp. ctTK08]